MDVAYLIGGVIVAIIAVYLIARIGSIAVFKSAYEYNQRIELMKFINRRRPNAEGK